jgi:D-xylose transport system permease protein
MRSAATQRRLALWGVSLLGVSSFYQLIIKGLIISLAVWFEVLQKKNWAG